MKTYHALISDLTEAQTATKRKTPPKFSDQWRDFRASLRQLPDNVKADSAFLFPWISTGHSGDQFTNDEIEKVKEKVFGKLGSSDIFFYTDEGLIVFPVLPNITHSDMKSPNNPKLRYAKLDKDKLALLHKSNVLGQGRIQHHAGGGGTITYQSLSLSHEKAALRAIGRAYPKYTIHDGSGNEFMESHRVCTFLQFLGEAATLSQRLKKFKKLSPNKINEPDAPALVKSSRVKRIFDSDKSWYNIKTGKIVDVLLYHVTEIVAAPKKFGITNAQILDVMDGEMFPEETYDQLLRGEKDTHQGLERLVNKLGWLRIAYNAGFSNLGIAADSSTDVMKLVDDVSPYWGKFIKSIVIDIYKGDRKAAIKSLTLSDTDDAEKFVKYGK